MPDSIQFLLLQTESVLMTFEPEAGLPFNLYTTSVCNCLCIVIYSPSKGVAYMGHLSLGSMKRDEFRNYIHTFDEMLRQHDLNNTNTQIALIGANQTITRTDLINFDDSTAALRFIEYFEDKSFSIHEMIRGKDTLERNIELTPTLIRVMEVEFAAEERILSYKEITIRSGESIKKKQLLSSRHYSFGEFAKEMEPKEVAQFNAAIEDKALLQELHKKANETIQARCICNRFEFFDVRQLAGMSVSNLLPLVKNNESSKVSAAIFNCAVRNPQLFQFIMARVDFEQLRNFSYEDINRFRFENVQQAIITKKKTVTELLAMPESSFNSEFRSGTPLRLSIDMSPATSPRPTKHPLAFS